MAGGMKIYLDTANLEEIRQASELGIVDGVTTNPALVAREGANSLENTKTHFARMCELTEAGLQQFFRAYHGTPNRAGKEG